VGFYIAEIGSMAAWAAAVFSVCAVVVSLFALRCALAQYRLAHDVFKADQTRRTCEATIKEVAKLNPHITVCYELAKTYSTNGKTLDLIRLPAGDPDRAKLVTCIDMLHMLGTGVEFGIYHDEMIVGLLGEWLPELVDMLEPLMDEIGGPHRPAAYGHARALRDRLRPMIQRTNPLSGKGPRQITRRGRILKKVVWANCEDGADNLPISLRVLTVVLGALTCGLAICLAAMLKYGT
jgi:hypothetical protein